MMSSTENNTSQQEATSIELPTLQNNDNNNDDGDDDAYHNAIMGGNTYPTATTNQNNNPPPPPNHHHTIRARSVPPLRPHERLVRRAPLAVHARRRPPLELLELGAARHRAVGRGAALGVQVEQAPHLLAQVAAARDLLLALHRVLEQLPHLHSEGGLAGTGGTEHTLQ